MKIERRSRWDTTWKPIDRTLQYLEDIYWSISRYSIIECFGDSHVKVFRRLNWLYPKSSFRFRTVSVMGATAYGLKNTNSVTSARKVFDKRIKRLPPKNYRLFLLGEIDAGFLIYFLANKKQITPHTMLEKSIHSYKEFLLKERAKSERIIVCSAPLPTVADPGKNPKYMSVRNMVDISIKDRTKMTIEFNQMLQDFCISNEITFINLDEKSLNNSTGLVLEGLLSIDQNDHHYDENAYAKILHDSFINMDEFKKKREING